MRYLILLITVLMVVPIPAFAAEVLILQGNTTRPMEQMTRLLQNDCSASNRTLVLSNYAELDLARLVREERPSVVVALGDQALAEAKKIHSVPVVYGMALNANEETLAGNVSGVSMIVAPRSYLQLFATLKLRRVAVIYDKKRTGPYLRRAMALANAMGVELVPLQVKSTRDVPQRLNELQRRKVDALWLLPDSTAVTPETVDNYFIVAHQRNIPVVAFSTAYLKKGALAAIELTTVSMGRQLCDKIKASRTTAISGTTDSATGKLFFNTAVADRIGILIPSVSILPATLSTDG